MSSHPEFDRFVEAIARLRGDQGCPWDKKQTHETLKPYLIEESYETLQAIDSSDPAAICEELGDVLLQIGLHSEIASESGRFDIEDVCRTITDKLIRRHPHVFGDVQVSGVEQVLDNWHAIKKAEKEQQPEQASSVLDHVTNTLPSLMLAMQVSKKAARAGFEWPDMAGVLAKMREEIAELEEALASGDRQALADEIGDLLFTVVNVSRWADVDAEEALRSMVGRFSSRFRQMEAAAAAEGRELESLTPEQWDDLWNQAKRSETP